MGGCLSHGTATTGQGLLLHRLSPMTGSSLTLSQFHLRICFLGYSYYQWACIGFPRSRAWDEDSCATALLKLYPQEKHVEVRDKDRECGLSKTWFLPDPAGVHKLHHGVVPILRQRAGFLYLHTSQVFIYGSSWLGDERKLPGTSSLQTFSLQGNPSGEGCKCESFTAIYIYSHWTMSEPNKLKRHLEKHQRKGKALREVQSNCTSLGGRECALAAKSYKISKGFWLIINSV